MHIYHPTSFPINRYFTTTHNFITNICHPFHPDSPAAFPLFALDIATLTSAADRDVRSRDKVSVSRPLETRISWSRSRSRGLRSRSRSRSRGGRSRSRSRSRGPWSRSRQVWSRRRDRDRDLFKTLNTALPRNRKILIFYPYHIVN